MTPTDAALEQVAFEQRVSRACPVPVTIETLRAWQARFKALAASGSDGVSTHRLHHKQCTSAILKLETAGWNEWRPR